MSNKCSICNQAAEERIVNVRSKKAIKIYHCSNCNFDFFDFDPTVLLVENKLDESRLKAAGLDIPSIEKDFENGLKQSQPLIAEYFEESDINRNVLEIGCSWGYFLQLIKEKGAKPYGIELNTVRTQYVNEHLAIPCYGSLEECEENGVRFKKIYLFYVVEYVPEPLKYFQRLINLLDTDGSIVFITPNLNDALKDIWQNVGFGNFFFDECAINYFSPESLKNLFDQLSNAKAEIITKQGYSFLNHVSWHFTNAPRTTGIVGGDNFINDLKGHILSSKVNFKEDFFSLISEFNTKYKEMLEKNDYGNQIICKICK